MEKNGQVFNVKVCGRSMLLGQHYFGHMRGGFPQIKFNLYCPIFLDWIK